MRTNLFGESLEPSIRFKAKLTRVDVTDGWCVKRDDRACFIGEQHACGSKVRQYLAMASIMPDKPMIVGCSADSCQQVYVADAAERTGRKGIVIVPKRKHRSAATQWCIDHSCEVIEIYPGYPSQCRGHARALAEKLGGAVRWNPGLAVEDTAFQCSNLPTWVKRIIVSTGSGLVAAGVLWGTADRKITVIAVCVSPLAKPERIWAAAAISVQAKRLVMIAPTSDYAKPQSAILPNGDILDPYYAAKALPYIHRGDCLWVTGRRPKSLCL